MRAVDRAKPHCEDCTRGKKKEKFSNAVDTLLDVLGG